MEEGDVLLDAVSMSLWFKFPRHVHSSAPSSVTTDRVYMSGLADTILFLANPGYFMLAKEFNVSVDDVASAFSSSYAGNAVFL